MTHPLAIFAGLGFLGLVVLSLVVVVGKLAKEVGNLRELLAADPPPTATTGRFAPYSGSGPWPQDGVPLPYEDEQTAPRSTVEIQLPWLRRGTQ